MIFIAFVRIDNDEQFERAFRRFKRIVEKEGIIREAKRREYFEKPSAIRIRKKKASDRKHEKRIKKSQSYA